ncbi:MAG: DUF6636 domain-containing protein [Solirubrobacterales bacterium]
MLRATLAIAIAFALMAAPATASQLRLFHTPGGNIGCEVFSGAGTGGGGARCDIARRSWKAPPQPANCHLDYGNGLIVSDSGRANFTCAGDTVLHQGFVLYAGGYVESGAFMCTNLGSAVRCLDRRTDHGFKLSRTIARRF